MSGLDHQRGPNITVDGLGNDETRFQRDADREGLAEAGRRMDVASAIMVMPVIMFAGGVTVRRAGVPSPP